MNILLLFAVLTSLFLGVNVLQNLGYLIDYKSGPGFMKIHPAFYLVSISFLIYIFLINTKHSFYKKNSLEFTMIFVFVILVLYIIIRGASGSISYIPNTLITPIFFSILLKNISKDYKERVFRLLLLFFVINSLTAIIEMFFKFHLFNPLLWGEMAVEEYRSTAFHNHPLNNSLINSILMSFILTSKIKDQYKFVLFFLGVISLICFGTRSSLFIWLILFVIYLVNYFTDFNSIKNKNNALFKRIYLPATIFVFSIAIYYLVFYTSFGNRILSVAYFDSSAKVRYDIFKIFDSLTEADILWGVSKNKSAILMSYVEVGIIENYWIGWILNFGLFFTFIVGFFLFKLIWKILNRYTKFEKLFIITVFIATSSANNSLATSTSALTLLVLCSYAFKPNKPSPVLV